jgi:hypothetical protein
MTNQAVAVPRVPSLTVNTDVDELRRAHLKVLRRARATRGEARTAFLRAATAIEHALCAAEARITAVGVSVDQPPGGDVTRIIRTLRRPEN